MFCIGLVITCSSGDKFNLIALLVNCITLKSLLLLKYTHISRSGSNRSCISYSLDYETAILYL